MFTGTSVNSLSNASKRGPKRTTTSNLPSRRKSAWEELILRRKHDIEIMLDGGEDFVHSYTTYDQIEGQVVFKFEKDTAIDDLAVTFEGLTLTYTDRIAANSAAAGRITGTHTFLKLLQPVSANYLPESRIAKAGESYFIPFQFVLPDRLLPYCCSHRVDDEEVRHAHLHLPPSLGDPELAANSQIFFDDFSPEMSKISYFIRARVAKRSLASGQVSISDTSRSVHVVPTKEEECPADAQRSKNDFIMRTQKDICRGLFNIGRMTGSLTAEAAQPRSFRLAPPRTQIQEPVSTLVTVNLRFDPQNADDQPPQPTLIACKLRACTFFGVTGFKMIPFTIDLDAWSTKHGMYSETVDLLAKPVDIALWTRQHPGLSTSTSLSKVSFHPSTISVDSTASTLEPWTPCSTSCFYTMSLDIPLALPKHKAFVPTFHSCLVSRSYVLELELSYKIPGASVSNSSIKLRIPVQVSSEGRQAPAFRAEQGVTSESERQMIFGPAAGFQPSSAAPEYEHTETTAPQTTEMRSNASAPMAQPAVPPAYFSGRGRMSSLGD